MIAVDAVSLRIGAILLAIGVALAAFVWFWWPLRTTGPAPRVSSPEAATLDAHLRRGGNLFLATSLAVCVLMPICCVGPCVPNAAPQLWLPQVAEHGAPIVAAIGRFTEERKRVPGSLSELVAGYLPALPTTGFPRGKWEYVFLSKGWSLCVPVDGFLDFDEFRYAPVGDSFGGYRAAARHGAWVYLDE